MFTWTGLVFNLCVAPTLTFGPCILDGQVERDGGIWWCEWWMCYECHLFITSELWYFQKTTLDFFTSRKTSRLQSISGLWSNIIIVYTIFVLLFSVSELIVLPFDNSKIPAVTMFPLIVYCSPVSRLVVIHFWTYCFIELPV